MQSPPNVPIESSQAAPEAPVTNPPETDVVSHPPGVLDWLVIFAYLGGVIAAGLWMGRKQANIEDYFLGGRKIPWGAALMSMIATEISAATFLGAPEQGYTRDLTYLQFGIGSIFARFVLAFMFMGIFYRLKVYTVYGFLTHRFGVPTKDCAAGSFLLGRFFASGSRLFIASLAVKVVTGMDLTHSIILLGAISIVYTFLGGIKAVIWTDVIQGVVLILGAFLSVAVLLRDIPLPLGDIIALLQDNAKFRLIDTSLGDGSGGLALFSNPYHLFPALVGGFFLTMATHGTDQAMIQRLLTCKDSFRGKLSMVLSGFLGLGTAVIFMVVGMLLFVYVTTLDAADPMLAIADGLKDSGQNGKFYLHYIVAQMPPGLSGLIIAAVIASAMSSIDSELNAMSSTFVTDFYTPYFKPSGSSRHFMQVARWGTAVFGALIIGIAVLIADFYAKNPDTDLLSIALGVMTLFYGGLLGIFLLGLLTKRRGSSLSNISGLVLSLALIIFISYKTQLIALFGLYSPDATDTGFWAWCYHVKLAWPWFIMIGTGVTFTIAVLGITAKHIRDRFDETRRHTRTDKSSSRNAESMINPAL